MHRRNPGEGISTGCLAVYLKHIHTLVMSLDPATFVSILKSIPFSSLSVLMALVVNDIQFFMMILPSSHFCFWILTFCKSATPFRVSAMFSMMNICGVSGVIFGIMCICCFF